MQKDNELEALASEVLTPKEKRRQTSLARYGVDNIAKVPEFQRRKKKSNLEKYGVENVNQVEEFRESTRKTNLERYGSIYPSHSEKGIETNLIRYGVRHPMQNFMVFQRSIGARFKIKNYETETGGIIQYQGYENVLIKFLLEDMKIEEDKIVTNRSCIPEIFYDNPITGKESRYYPDIWISGTNMLFEVKSKFTLKLNTDVTLKKQAECKSRGFNCIIVVCSKKEILELIL